MISPRRARAGAAHRRLLAQEAPDPLSGFANLFDLALVLAAAMLVAVSAAGRLHPAKAGATREVAVPDQQRVKLTRFREGGRRLTGRGERLGTAYRLENGDVVYVPGPPPG